MTARHLHREQAPARIPGPSDSPDEAGRGTYWTTVSAYLPDLIEQLRDQVRQYHPSPIVEFIDDIRRDPSLALVCAGLGMVAGMLAVVIPCVVIARTFL